MTKPSGIERLASGVRNLDALVDGGIPAGSLTIVAGPPGSGKTTLTQQICFHIASAKKRVLYFNTLSEPTAKMLRFLARMHYFDVSRIGSDIEFVDLGVLLRSKGLEQAASLMMEHVQRVKPAVVVIDSFKCFDDLATSSDELRKFSYRIAVDLMAWEATVFLIGEYSASDYQTNPLFSIADGLVVVAQREEAGEQQRFIQVLKMRGTAHSRDEHSFRISEHGIDIYAPQITIKRSEESFTCDNAPRCLTRISRLDDVLGGGIPWGSSLLVAGVAGCGKTVASLEFIYRGALAGENGVLFSFEETAERLLATARGLGWDLEREIRRKRVEMIFIPQPEIAVEEHLLLIHDRISANRARRVAVDSLSVFLHKIRDPQVAREKTFQVVTIIQNAGAVGFLATDIPYGSTNISRFGVEETVVDGVLLLSSTPEGMDRQRYLEVYKLRNADHLKGRHNLLIGPGGLDISPRYRAEDLRVVPAALLPTAKPGRPLRTGVPGLDELMGGGYLERSATLVSGSTGIGKSTLALQFALGGTKSGPAIFASFEEGVAQLVQNASRLGLPVKSAVASHRMTVDYLSREHVRPTQLVRVLSDRIQEKGASRLVLDGIGHLASNGMTPEELQRLLHTLVRQLKALGVTSLLTLEVPELFSIESATDRDLSGVADNLVLLRYRQAAGKLVPTVLVLKTRGSAHDSSAHAVKIGHGGLAVKGQLDEERSVRVLKIP